MTIPNSEQQVLQATRLDGWWLLLGRITWAVLVGLALVVLVTAVPVKLAVVTNPSAASRADLAILGLSIPAGAVSTIVLGSGLVVAFMAIATIIILKRPDDWMALLPWATPVANAV